MHEDGPCSFDKISAISLAEGSLGMGIKWTILEKQSTTVRMAVFPSDGGKPVMKSNDSRDRALQSC